MAKVKLIKDGQETILDYSQIKEISQALGDIRYLHDYCGVWLKCSACRKKGDGTYCGKRFVSSSIRSDPGPVVVEFVNGEIDTFDAWEEAP